MDIKKYVVDVFCDRSEIQNLVSKAFNENDYTIRFNPEVGKDDISIINSDCDCIIIDRNIDKKLRLLITEKFNDIPKVYLPSLDNENVNGKNAIYISEPLRLSELKTTVETLIVK